MIRILISTCLLGANCRYSGEEGSIVPEISELQKEFELIPVCPEVYGGLPTPRLPAERQGNRVVTKEGGDVTEAFQRGAEETLKLARLFHCSYAILKENSPSCGAGMIYDGTFTGKKISGHGVTAALLQKNGIQVIGESQIKGFLQQNRNTEK